MDGNQKENTHIQEGYLLCLTSTLCGLNTRNTKGESLNPFLSGKQNDLQPPEFQAEIKGHQTSLRDEDQTHYHRHHSHGGLRLPAGAHREHGRKSGGEHDRISIKIPRPTQL